MTHLQRVYQMLLEHPKLSSGLIFALTDGEIRQSDAGHLLRELAEMGVATRSSNGRGRGTPFFYSLLPGTTLDVVQAKHRAKVKVLDIRKRSDNPKPKRKSRAYVGTELERCYSSFPALRREAP